VKLFGNLRKRSGQGEEPEKEIPTQPLPAEAPEVKPPIQTMKIKQPQ
jgi:hypothetical protein